jgi:alcohol dehydrogenase (NADP+)
MRVNAYAAPAAGQPLVPTTIERRQVGPNDVLIQIQYAGICHSDIHTVNGDWGPQPFPVVPGHEIVGLVTDVGTDVTRHKIGDRVGVGCMVNSCRECTNCRNGDEQYCLNGMVPTYAGTDRDGTTTQGGYSTHVVVDADYVLAVPEGIDAAAAAPLLCAGITTYAPLRHWGAGPGKKVAVVGLGGLGHMAVKIAQALGAEVSVLRRTVCVLARRPTTPPPIPRPSSSSPAGSTSSSTPSARALTSMRISGCSQWTARWSTSAPRPSR